MTDATGSPETRRLTRKDIVAGFRILIEQLQPYKHNMVVFIIFGVLVAIGNALLPYIVGALVDTLVSPTRTLVLLGETVPLWFGMLLLWCLVRLAVIGMRDHILRNSTNHGLWLYSDYLVRSLHHLIRLPLSFHKTHKIGEVVTKVGYTADYIEKLVANTFLEMGPTALSIVVALGMTYFVNFEIGLVLTVTLLLYGVLFVRGVGLLSVLQTQSYDAHHATWGDAGDYMGNVRQVKEVVAEDFVKHDLHQKMRIGWCGIWATINARSANLSLAQEAATYLAQVFIFAYSIVHILNGGMTVGELLAVNGYAIIVFGPFDILTREWKNIQNGIIHINETQKLLDIPEEVCVPNDVVPLSTIRGDVTFNDVHFGYDESREILKGISFKSEAGQTIAIVGESGVGKTTLVDLILGFHMPTSGTVIIDGVSTTRLDLHFLRKHVAIVTQDIVLFNDTIMNNLTFGLTAKDQHTVEHAAEQASARSFIEEFPDRWDQIVGERGIKLSGGQRQRIAIARAILKDPAILILDEPTSALDARTEDLLQQSLEKIMAGKTTFVIAHRFSTVRNADRIIVLKEGTVVQQGTHRELIAVDGEYKHLYNLQIGLRE